MRMDHIEVTHIVAKPIDVHQYLVVRLGGEREGDDMLPVGAQRAQAHFGVSLADRVIVSEGGGVFDP